MKILITGASGFIGQQFMRYKPEKYNLFSASLQKTALEEIHFKDINCVVHLAGMAHQMKKIDPQIYFDVNFELTKNLAQTAKAAGVSHFIFVSTIKVFGDHSQEVLTEDSPCHPDGDPYGQSKLKAEEYLKSIEDPDFKIAIVRPPLVYGPGVKGNLIRLLKLANSPNLLPLSGINNRRTLVCVDNLIEMIHHIIDQKAEGLFLAGDAKPISTSFLIAEMRRALGRKKRLFAMPKFVISIMKAIKPALALRLFGSLEMDTTHSFARLNFIPPYSIEEGIKKMVDHYKSNSDL